MQQAANYHQGPLDALQVWLLPERSHLARGVSLQSSKHDWHEA
jgi:hypothetical protein